MSETDFGRVIGGIAALEDPLKALEAETFLQPNRLEEELCVLADDFEAKAERGIAGQSPEQDTRLRDDLRTELVLHFVRAGDSATAISLLAPVKDEVSQTVHPTTVSYLDNKLRIFREAAEREDEDLISYLGDLRAESELSSPLAFGKYLLEEIRLGINVHANLDDVAVIANSNAGVELDTSPALGDLLAKLYLAGNLDEVKQLVTFCKSHNVTYDETVAAMIQIATNNLKLSEVVGPLERHDLKTGSSDGKLLRPSKKKIAKSGREWLRDFFYSAKSAQGFTPIILSVLEKDIQPIKTTTSYGLSERQEIWLSAYQKLPAGGRKLYDALSPQMASAIKALMANQQEAWLAHFHDPDLQDAPPAATMQLANIYHLENLDQRLWPEVIARLSEGAISKTTVPEKNTETIASQIAAQIELLRLEYGMPETSRPYTMIDGLRYLTAVNQSLRRLHKIAVKEIHSHVDRIDILEELYRAQLVYDPNSVDSNLRVIGQSLTDSVQACLNNPIDRRLYGEQALHGLLDELTKARAAWPRQNAQPSRPFSIYELEDEHEDYDY